MAQSALKLWDTQIKAVEGVVAQVAKAPKDGLPLMAIHPDTIAPVLEGLAAAGIRGSAAEPQQLTTWDKLIRKHHVGDN